MLEEGKFDLLAIKLARLGGKGDITDRCAIAAGPSAVNPGAHHDGVRTPGALSLDAAICLQGSKEILRIEPSADGQHRGLDVL